VYFIFLSDGGPQTSLDQK